MKNKNNNLIIKKVLMIIVILIGIFVLGLLIYNIIKGPTSAERFKNEYEIYNDIEYKMKDEKNKYIELDIDKENPIVYLSEENLISEMTKGNKIIYFGFPDCNWCRSAVKVLLDTAKDNGIEQIYYYNPYNIRNAYEEGKNSDESKLYENLVKQLDKYIHDKFESGTNKDKKKLTVPTVVLIKDGKVKTYHNGTVSSHTEYEKELTNSQYDELYKIFDDMMVDLLMCTEETDCND